MSGTITVDTEDLAAALKCIPPGNCQAAVAIANLAEALQRSEPAVQDAAQPPLPEGIYGRVEFPGMRSDTGWITDGTRGGQCVLVVRDWDSLPLGEYILGPACRLVHLPTPLKRPEPQAALPAGPRPDFAGDEDEYDEYGVASCGCAPGFTCAECRAAGVFP